MDFDLRQLQIFQKVVELRSYSDAAKAVHLAQASVSERMASLERMIGMKLLDRVGREIVPTKAGELLYKEAIKHLELKRQTCMELEAFLGIRKGDIEIGGSTIPAEYILPGIIRRFREDYPDIIVRLRIGDSDEISQLVSKGMLEFGVVGSRVKARGLMYREIWKDELVLVVPPSHRWARRQAISPQELSQEPFIQRERGSGTRQMLEQRLLRAGSAGLDSFRVVSQLGSSTAVKEGIRNGLGVSILSRRAVVHEVEEGSLKIIPLEKISLQRSFYLIHDRGRTQSPLCRILFEFLQSKGVSDPSVQRP
jgi:DNA-binding transcriptional LysR family regulator